MKPGMSLITRRCLCVCMSSTWGGQQAIIRIIPVLIYEALKHLNLNNCFMSWMDECLYHRDGCIRTNAAHYKHYMHISYD